MSHHFIRGHISFFDLKIQNAYRVLQEVPDSNAINLESNKIKKKKIVKICLHSSEAVINSLQFADFFDKKIFYLRFEIFHP